MTCELCGSSAESSPYEVHPRSDTVSVCGVCRDQIAGSTALEPRHWFCLRESMWSENAAVQVLAHRVLKRLDAESWAQELLMQLYLEPEIQAWADAGTVGAAAGGDDDAAETTRDSNGTVLQTGDTVTLIKDLDVKGANFTAKRGTTVKGIALTDDPKYVEGKVNGIRIVLVAAYLKKA